MTDLPTPYDDAYEVARLLKEIEAQPKYAADLKVVIDARLARLHGVIDRSGLLRVGWGEGTIVKIERYSGHLIARLAPVQSATMLPAYYPGTEPAPSVSPLTLANLDDTEAA